MISVLNRQYAWRYAWVLFLAISLVPETMAENSNRENTGSANAVRKILAPKQQMEAHTEDLRDLMLQLYEMSPQELTKSTEVSAREMVDWVFGGGKAGWKFEAIRGAQGKEAVALAFEPSYQGDAVLPLVVGLETLLFTAYRAKNEYAIPTEINVSQLKKANCELEALNQVVRAIGNGTHQITKNQLLGNKNVRDALGVTLNKISSRLEQNADVNGCG